MSITFCSTTDSIAKLIDNIEDLQKDGTVLYVDLEGRDLCRHGTISLITILIQPSDLVYDLDVHALKQSVFSTAGRNGYTFKQVLESTEILKVFFDVRNDSDALFAHFGIKLQGVEDIQLMENASRTSRSKKFLCGLQRCVQVELSKNQFPEKDNWMNFKSKGEVAGYYEETFTRPLNPDILRYCTGDVEVLPLLRKSYLGKLNELWKTKVKTETENIVRLLEPGIPAT